MAVVAAVIMLVTGVARAQFAQYIPPGSLGVPDVPTKERIEAAVDGAPFRLGPLRLATWFALENINWVDNVYGTATDPKSDLTGTASVGVHGYLHSGQRLILGFYALPEYVWWRDLTYLRSWNGRYGVGLFGYFKRVSFELQAADWRSQQSYSSEDQIPVTVKQQRGSASVEVAVLGRLSMFGSAREDRWRYEDQNVVGVQVGVFRLSDRNDQRVTGGLRYRFSKRVAIGLGYERLTTDFQHELRDRSNSGGGARVEVEMRGKRLWANAKASVLSLEARGNSEFVPFGGTAGQFQMGWKPAGRVEFQVYGGRNISYTVADPNPYYLDQRVGFGVQTPIGWRSNGRIHWEKGRDEFPPVPGDVGRTDDLEAYGLAVDFRLWRRSALGLEGSRTNYTSTLPGFDRSITRIRVTLRLSRAGDQWW